MKIATKLKSILVAACAVLFCSVLIAPSALAKTAMSLAISPTYEKPTLIPGKSYSSTVEVTNTDDEEDMTYEALVGSYGIFDNNYKTPDVATKGASNDLMDWITIDPDTASGTITPHQTVNVNFTIDVPKNANPGGQYASILIKHLGNKDAAKGSATVGSDYQLAYVIYGTVAGDMKEAGSVLENNVSSFFLDSKIGGTSIVENTGNVHFSATYTLRVFPLFSNEEVYTNEEKPDTWLIMPGTSRFISTTWDESPNIGIFTVEQEIKFLDQTSTTSKLVIVMPIWLLLAIVFVIVFWIIWLVMRHKNRKSGKGKKSTKPSTAAKPAAHSVEHKPEHASEKPESDKSTKISVD